MLKTLTSLLLVMPASHGGLSSSKVPDFKKAQELERFQPDKACDLYTKLSEDAGFVLQDLAFIRQGMVCENPRGEAPYDLKKKPWLLKKDLERQLRFAEKNKDVLERTRLKSQLARMEKSPKVALQNLNALEAEVKKSGADKETAKKSFALIQEMREEIAPRFIKNPKPAQFLKVAQDHLSAREFLEARKWSQKLSTRKDITFDEALSARRIRRTSFKLENLTDAFLDALKKDWTWAQTQRYPGKASEIGILYTKALWTEGKNTQARTVLNEVEKKYSKTLRLNEIHLIRGKMAEEKKDWKTALSHYDKVKPELKTNLDKKIQFAKAWVGWKAKEDSKALEALEALIALGDEDPFESSRALYWKYRVLKRADKITEAKAALKTLQGRDPLGFYGVLAYREAQENFPPLKLPKVSSRFEKSPLYEADYFQALADVGEMELLQAASTHSLSQVPINGKIEDSLPVFLAAAKANSYLPLFSQISSLTPENRASLLEKDPQLIFPMDYKELIEKSSQRFSIPPELVFSIIRQESAFNTFARSPADALGLMQLLPSISKAYSKEVGIPVDHFEDLYLPEVNIPYGTILLRDLMKKYDQKVYMAAAAYNASEKALKNWIKMRWNGDPVEFIEEVPYEETRAYMKLIIRNFAFYSRLLNSGKPTPFPKGCLGD